MKVQVSLFFAILSFLKTVVGQCNYDWPENPKDITVCPLKIAQEANLQVIFRCYWHKTQPPYPNLIWIHQNGTNMADIAEADDRFKVLHGNSSQPPVTELHIHNLTYTDAGNYYCQVFNASETYNVRALLKVFDMPSYIPEIIGIGVGIAVLLAVFTACSLMSYLKQRKVLNRLKYKPVNN